MGRVEKISVALTPELAETLREAIASGEYASAGDVMSAALRDWQERRLRRAEAVAELGRLWDEGIASGSAPEDGEAAFARIRQSLDARLAGDKS